MSDERDPLGGGPAEAIAAIMQGLRGPSQESRPSSGFSGPGPSSVTPVDGSTQPGTQVVNWVFLPALLPTGYLNPDPSSNLGLHAGLQYRQFVGQRLIGWSNKATGVGSDWVSTPADGYSGKVPAPIAPVNGLPVETRPAADAH